MKYKVIERIAIEYPVYFKREVTFEKLCAAEEQMESRSKILHSWCYEGKIQDYQVEIEAVNA